MHRLNPSPFALAAAVLATGVVACSDEPRPTPTGPQVRAEVSALKPGAACDATLERQIYSQINALFTGAVQTQARTLFGQVVAACPTGAIPQLLTYVQFTIDRYHAGQVLAPSPRIYPSRADAVVDNWEFAFRYVYNNDAQLLPVPEFSAQVLMANGGARVIDATSADAYLVNGTWTAGILVPDQAAGGVAGSRLYTITPADPNCLATNLQEPAPAACFHFEADPALTTQFSPQATVAMCEGSALPEGSPVPANHALAHATGGQTRLTYRVAVPFNGVPAGEPVLCADHAFTSPYVFSDGLGPATRYALGRAASSALNFLSPRPLWASHTSGLGGTVGLISPFSPVMTHVFAATFGPSATVSADIGVFDSVYAKQPGSITVQQALGDLTDWPVVLTQSGGNCDPQCGGLVLRGRNTTFDATQDATYGSYSVSWQSLQDKPTLKKAPFVVRDAALREIATVAYEVHGPTPVLTYKVRDPLTNVVNTVVLSTGWTQHEAQLFQLVVNLDTKRTSLYIDGVAVIENVLFVDAFSGVQTLRYVAAEFSGIDAGTIAWDNIYMTRQYDSPLPPNPLIPMPQP